MLDRLYLVRHGQTDWNLAGRIQGHEGTGLNETGCAQADWAAWFLMTCPLVAVWSSDLPRALETAERIAAPHGLAVRPMSSLRERDLTPLEGMSTEEAMAVRREAGLDHGDFSGWTGVPGVEQDQSMLARLLPVLTAANELPGEVVLVTHGGPQRVLLHYLLGIPETARCWFGLTNGTVIALGPRDGHWQVEGMYGPAVLTRLGACAPRGQTAL